ncbi:hypothetical protein [Acaryochloris sp. CCMEE 5410]|uniref:hypothetical protein n=1 Tax=Acaryochloris sp. CCMEE 5410 TaxID=310037 RepID=UPI0021CE17E6|nr:hypothetical protein [Acaryochloris sp. CCMEE 5410]
MLLADRGFANHQLMSWLQQSRWHYCLRIPCDVLLHGPVNVQEKSVGYGHPKEKLSSTVMSGFGMMASIGAIWYWRISEA